MQCRRKKVSHGHKRPNTAHSLSQLSGSQTALLAHRSPWRATQRAAGGNGRTMSGGRSRAGGQQVHLHPVPGAGGAHQRVATKRKRCRRNRREAIRLLVVDGRQAERPRNRVEILVIQGRVPVCPFDRLTSKTKLKVPLSVAPCWIEGACSCLLHVGRHAVLDELLQRRDDRLGQLFPRAWNVPMPCCVGVEQCRRNSESKSVLPI